MNNFRYISENDQISNGLFDLSECVHTMEDMFSVFTAGDYVMGGINKQSHGMSIHFPSGGDCPKTR
jgi:ornithine cyclodeaminase